MNKSEKLRLESCQKEFLAIMYEFRNALQVHFNVVDNKATNLINTRWGD